MTRLLIVAFLAFVACALSERSNSSTTFADELPKVALDRLAVETIDGQRWNWVDQENSPFTVFLFVNTTCPIANACQPRLMELSREFVPKGFRFVEIHADPKLTIEAAREHAREFEIRIPVALDPSQMIAKTLGAKVTPEAIVVDRHAQILYRGRIDDQFVGYGKKRPTPTREDLREALNELCAGKPITVRQTTPVGCLIHLQ